MTFLTLAGHGGPYTGALNPYHPDLPEKAVNLLIDSAFYNIARANGHTVHRLRTGDYHVPLEEVYPEAVRVGADAVFEIHCDSVSDQNARGCHAIALPTSLSWSLAGILPSWVSVMTGIPNLGRRDHLWGDSPTPIYTWSITRFVQLASQLHLMSENGFLSNAADEAILTSPAGQTQIAWAHLAAVHDLYGLGTPALAGRSSAVPILLGAGLLAAWLLWGRI